MKSKEQVADTMQQISDPSSPVGMDAVYVHALILGHLHEIERRLDRLERQLGEPGREPAARPQI